VVPCSPIHAPTRHLLFNLPLAKLYSNSLMSSLNARGGWRRSEPDDSGEVKTVPLHLSVRLAGLSHPLTSLILCVIGSSSWESYFYHRHVRHTSTDDGSPAVLSQRIKFSQILHRLPGGFSCGLCSISCVNIFLLLTKGHCIYLSLACSSVAL
jgi:hypothetical protein